MKKLFILTTVLLIIFMSAMNVSAMTYNEFMETYPNDYIYRVNYPTGHVNYISSPAELQFELEPNPTSGDEFVVINSDRVTYYRLTDGGFVETYGDERVAIWNHGLGFEGDIDIYIWSGYAFFLPLPSQLLGKMVGVFKIIMTKAGFGIVLLVVLILLLKVFQA